MFQHLLQSWLKDLARRKMQETVVKAAGEQLRGQSEAAARCDELFRECDAGVIFAIRSESGGFEDLLQDSISVSGDGLAVRLGKIEGRRVAVTVSGAGRKRAAAATEAILRAHAPKLVVSAGFAGGLQSDLRRGNLILADSVCLESGEPITLDPGLLSAEARTWPRLSIGRLLSVDRIIRAPEEKRALGAKYAAQAVEMETYAVAEVCRRLQSPFLAVRVVLDPADERLPHEVENLLEQQSAAGRAGAALGAIFNRPGSVKDLYRLKENALIASDRLAKFLARVIAAR